MAEREDILRLHVVHLTERMEEINAAEEKFRMERHDFRHKLETVASLVEKKEYDALQALVLTDAQTGENKTVSVSAVFAAIGHMPNCAPIAGLAALDDGGYAVADEHCRTATPGLFVAGDCRTKEIRQLTTATADGTAAAVAACEYLG